MHCIILAREGESFPHALRPIQGRAALDYLIDDVISQKEITAISIITNKTFYSLLKKHLKNAYPNNTITVLEGDNPRSVLNNEDDILLIQRVVHTSLKLQDFIRYFKQYKTITKASYDRVNPKEIPFVIIPQKDCQKIDTLFFESEFHSFNSGTGFCTI